MKKMGHSISSLTRNNTSFRQHMTSIQISLKEAHALNLVSGDNFFPLSFSKKNTQVLIQRNETEGPTRGNFKLIFKVRGIQVDHTEFSYFDLVRAQRQGNTRLPGNSCQISLSEMLFFLERKFGVGLDCCSPEQLSQLRSLISE